MALGWTFRTTVAPHGPTEPTSMLAERAVGGWIDLILIEGHDQAQGMRYETYGTPRRPRTEKVLRHVDGALAEVVYRVLKWPADRG